MTRALFSLAMLLVAGCSSTDDCETPPFANPTIGGGLQGTADAPFVAVTWAASPGDLPDAYFEQAQVAPASLAAGVSYVSPRELDIRLVPLDQLPTDQDISISVELPDTREFTSCHHPGMADVYSFTVDLRFDASHALTRADVAPIVRTPGAI